MIEPGQAQGGRSARAGAERSARQLAEVSTANALILPLWRTGLTVETKSDESPVTAADQRGEALILEALSRAFPDIPTVAEETVSASGAPTAIARRCHIGPLDGARPTDAQEVFHRYLSA